MSGGEIIKTPNALKKAKVGTGPAKLDNALLERAEAAVQKLEVNYNEWVKDDLAEIEKTLKKLIAAEGKDKNAIKALYRVVFDTKGQGGSFGYPLLTEVAGSLAAFIRDMDELDRFALEVAAAHVSAMRAIVKEQVRDDGGETGKELVQGLYALVARASAADTTRK